MNTRPRFGIKSMIVATAFAAPAFAWWRDRQHLGERIIKAQLESVRVKLESERVVRENSVMRQSLRSAQSDIDSLFAQTLSQRHAINQLEEINRLKQLAHAALQEPGANQ